MAVAFNLITVCGTTPYRSSMRRYSTKSEGNINAIFSHLPEYALLPKSQKPLVCCSHNMLVLLSLIVHKNRICSASRKELLATFSLFLENYMLYDGNTLLFAKAAAIYPDILRKWPSFFHLFSELDDYNQGGKPNNIEYEYTFILINLCHSAYLMLFNKCCKNVKLTQGGGDRRGSARRR